LGLRTMRERAELLGGALHIVSAPQEGTRVSLTIPQTPG
jgi:signal transduction histidine kinase